MMDRPVELAYTSTWSTADQLELVALELPGADQIHSVWVFSQPVGEKNVIAFFTL